MGRRFRLPVGWYFRQFSRFACPDGAGLLCYLPSAFSRTSSSNAAFAIASWAAIGIAVIDPFARQLHELVQAIEGFDVFGLGTAGSRLGWYRARSWPVWNIRSSRSLRRPISTRSLLIAPGCGAPGTGELCGGVSGVRAGCEFTGAAATGAAAIGAAAEREGVRSTGACPRVPEVVVACANRCLRRRQAGWLLLSDWRRPRPAAG